ncbi:hypothetical protein PCASD_21875 [Puccinia coronata f. sp. avenae]|uniref:Tyr recombinase domain-containing protein n=1 Tax=Puccinia coronata f. sp. avenae TaxID=200324 RepID=A0A2N5SHU6_9BASI|nr:hypothetical protein PCASD_21875 [Puccinia coronata f. sp. avenae]
MKSTSGLLVDDLWQLYQLLSRRGPEAEVVRDLAIVAFWGMARLAEVTYLTKYGVIPYKTKIAVDDVHHYAEAMVLILHEAKTAKPGKTQSLKLRPRIGPLCPVKAIERRLATTSAPSDSLFGFGERPHRINLTKRRTNKILRAAWRELGCPELSGHLFRVGGASIRSAIGVGVEDIKRLGRWTSECYQLYVKPLPPEEIARSVAVLQNPNPA